MLIHRSFRLSEDDIGLLNRMAKEAGRPLAWQMRHIIRQAAVEAGYIREIGDIGPEQPAQPTTTKKGKSNDKRREGKEVA